MALQIKDVHQNRRRCEAKYLREYKVKNNPDMEHMGHKSGRVKSRQTNMDHGLPENYQMTRKALRTDSLSSMSSSSSNSMKLAYVGYYSGVKTEGSDT